MELADDDDPSGRWCTVCFAAQKQTGLRSCHSGDRGLAQQECTVRRRGRNRAVIPGNTGQLHDGGPSAARTALAYAKQKDEMYIFQGGNYTPDNIKTCSAAWVVTPRFCSTAGVIGDRSAP